MKLLFCPRCDDVRALDYKVTSCACGAAQGRYMRDGWHAEVNERALVVALNNHRLTEVLASRQRELAERERCPDARVTVRRNPQLDAWLVTDSDRVRVVREFKDTHTHGTRVGEAPCWKDDCPWWPKTA